MTAADRFTAADSDRLDLPEGWRAEIIDGALYVSKAPGWNHQGVIVRLLRVVGDWADEDGGAVNAGIGLLHADDDNGIPDVVGISAERLAHGLDAAGHLSQAGPELVIEVVSPGSENGRRVRQAKLTLYSRRGALEYCAPSSLPTICSPVTCWRASPSVWAPAGPEAKRRPWGAPWTN
jgi:Uma2 family endonuclease